MRDMQPMTLAEIENAPFRVTKTAHFDATPEALWGQFADVTTWPQWFPMMYRAEWVTSATSGVGAAREVSLRVFGKYREQFIAWEPGARFSFTMTASTSPLVKQMGEDWKLTREGNGVRLDWTVGGVPTTVGKVGAPALRAVLSRLFVGGGANLAKRLAQRGTQVA